MLHQAHTKPKQNKKINKNQKNYLCWKWDFEEKKSSIVCVKTNKSWVLWLSEPSHWVCTQTKLVWFGSVQLPTEFAHWQKLCAMALLSFPLSLHTDKSCVLWLCSASYWVCTLSKVVCHGFVQLPTELAHYQKLCALAVWSFKQILQTIKSCVQWLLCYGFPLSLHSNKSSVLWSSNVVCYDCMISPTELAH